ncbi:unnamed protein product [Arabidopsis lyrata]|nr:unnamed protein product [Arabidopsis lyrata]
MDRISGLPDEILCHTLSFLSTKEAASTSLLSKRWRNLFTCTPNLRFVEEDEDLFNGNTGLDVLRSFCDFVDRVLAVSGNSPVKEFTLNYHHDVESAHINLWISNVLSRGVLDHLHLHVIARGRTPLPLAVFTCKTLVKLKLGRGFVIFYALLSACRVLEQLLIRGMDFEDWEWCRTVSSATLKRLTISCLGCRGFCDADFKSTTFDTPSLTYLDYASFLPDEYPIVNLDSLVEAKLNLMGMRIVTNIRNPTNLIKGLRNVEILDLSTLKTCEIFSSFGEAIPVLENLSRLSIKTEYNYWEFLPLLLKKSPNLQTLVIKGPSAHYFHDYGSQECLSGYSFLLSCPVKVIEIHNFWGTIGEFKQVKLFLEKFPCLELLKVSAWGSDQELKLQIATDLPMLPRACKIQLEFFP